MPDLSDDSLIETIRLYRETLLAIRKLYVESGKLIRGSYGWLNGGDDPEAASLADQMDELHQGLVMKIYGAAIPSLQAEEMPRRQLGRATLEHIWGTTVMGSRLREAVQWLTEESEKLRWQDLVLPFAKIPPLRDKWGELESLIVRAATLIATADGHQSADDNDLLSAMREQLDRIGDRTPDRFVSGTRSSREALVWLREEAERLRRGTAVGPNGGDAKSGDALLGDAGSTAEASDPRKGDFGGTPVATPVRSGAGPSPSRGTDAGGGDGKDEEADTRTPEERLADAKRKLDELVGLKSIKESVETLTNFLAMERRRAEEGLPTTQPSLHMAFVGNPGTGKTSVARIVAEIYGALGILQQGHLVETDRTGLVAEYAGQTGPKTNAKIDEALDGVLFIDEAYTLIDESGQDQYGREAVQTLLKRMEDQRDRLVVILAGYTDEMRKMIRSNPGLSSRVGTTMEFEDYSPEELCRIFGLIAGKAKYELPTESRRRLLHGFTFLYATRDRHFGNGRAARNSFERSVKRLANRLSGLKEINRGLLTTLEPEDIEVADVTPAFLENLAAETMRVRITCPATGKPMIIDDRMLGTEIRSEHCDQTFFADWGSPVLVTEGEAEGSADAGNGEAKPDVIAGDSDADVAPKG
ncbi:MAG: AAA family ATPase [Planctomycetaceae bacterium]|nr:MAG: AAA family ATPase [Planctomycetaceae bacterium]